MVSFGACAVFGGGRANGGGSSFAYHFAVEAGGGFKSSGAAYFYFRAEEHVGEDYEVGLPWSIGEGMGWVMKYGADRE